MYRAVTDPKSRTLKKLEAFLGLPHGWHYGSGDAPSARAVEIAADLLNTLILNGMTRTDAFAGADGEVLLTGYYQRHHVAFTIDPTGEIACSYENAGHDVSEVDAVDTARAKEWLVREVARRIWNTSDLFTLGTLTIISTDSTTWHSKNPLMVVACPSSTANAGRLQVA
jgi:hypothetical protein